MGRAELLFGELASERIATRVSRHARSDPALPLRMQANGHGIARRRRTMRWQWRLWGRALRSNAAQRRATIIALIALAVQTLFQIPLGRLALFAVLAGAVALVAGAWTEVAMLTDQLDAASN